MATAGEVNAAATKVAGKNEMLCWMHRLLVVAQGAAGLRVDACAIRRHLLLAVTDVGRGEGMKPDAAHCGVEVRT
jgi:hypothetical protein